MRLIYSILFLFGSYGATFIRANPVLDLDTYDPEDFNLVIDHKTLFNLEIFTPKSGNVINVVSDSGVVLYSSDDHSGVTISKVEVSSVQSVPQYVRIISEGNGVEYFFKKSGNDYTTLNSNQYDLQFKDLASGTYKPNLEFSVNIRSGTSTRNLYTKDLQYLDGVKSFVFKPTGDQQITAVNDGSTLVLTAGMGEYFTEIRAFENQGQFVLLSADGVKDGKSSAHFYHKQAGWISVSQGDYTHFLAQLRPLDVQERVTLDLSNPDQAHFHVLRDHDSGLVETIYSPNPGFNLTKVTNGDVELWSSNETRSSKVVAYTVKDVVELVQVEVKAVNGDTVYVSLYNSHGDFSPVSEHEFSERVQLFKQYLREQRASGTGHTPPGPSVLDVASPDPSFTVVTKSFKGVLFKEFIPNETADKLTKVVSSGKEIWTSKAGDTVSHVNVFLKNNVPAVYEVVGTEAGGREFDVFMKWDQTLAVRLNLQMFSQFLNSAAKPPSFTTSLDLDFEGTEPEHVTAYTSKVYGVPNTVFQADEGYYFRNVSAGEGIVWGTTGHPGVTVNQVILFKKGETGALLELEGFHNGNFVSYFFSNRDGTWTTVDETRFKRELLLLRFPNLEGETHPSTARRHSLPQVPAFDGDTSMETPEETPEGPETDEVPELQVIDFDTDNFDESQVNYTAGSDEGYYYKMFSPKHHFLFGSVSGPHGFSFNGNGERLVTLVKFYWVHAKLVGGTLYTVSKSGQGTLVYYYTYQDQEWTYSMTSDALKSLLANEAAFTEEQKKDLARLAEADAKLTETLAKLKLEKEQAREARRLAREKANPIVVPPKLSHKKKLYTEMADFEQHPPPKMEEPVETEEELKKRTHKYAGEDVAVQSELLYFELSTPTENEYVHTKSYTCMGLPALDVTPFAGKYLHIVSSNGKRVWVSSTNKRATNMQVFYVDGQIVGAVLTLTSIVRGNLVSGEEYDYLFVKDGELQKVGVGSFMDLANTRFQSAALLNLSKTAVPAPVTVPEPVPVAA